MNIFLVGYRGSGKTTLGKSLAKELSLQFVDTDASIVEKAKMSIPQIFEKEGEEAFRSIESEILQDVSKNGGQVISTGGGIILKSENREILKSSGITIYLKASPEVLYKRISHDKNRPALTNLPPMEEIKRLLEQREVFYQEVATITVNTELDIGECIKIIKNKLAKQG